MTSRDLVGDKLQPLLPLIGNLTTQCWGGMGLVCSCFQLLEFPNLFLHVQWISKDDSARKTLWCAYSASVWEAEPRQCWSPASTSSSILPSLWSVYFVSISAWPNVFESVLIYNCPKKYWSNVKNEISIQANFVIMNRPREHLDSLLRWLGRREGARLLQKDIVSLLHIRSSGRNA